VRWGSMCLGRGGRASRAAARACREEAGVVNDDVDGRGEGLHRLVHRLLRQHVHARDHLAAQRVEIGRGRPHKGDQVGACVENKVAQTSASWRSGGLFQRSRLPRASAGMVNGPLGHIGLVFHMGRRPALRSPWPGRGRGHGWRR
jgi:hypothetical protein